MGFVDFTPKKKSVLEDAVQQIEGVIGKNVAEPSFVEKYASSGGDEIPLYMMSYGGAYKDNIEQLIKASMTYVINSPLLVPGIRIRRERPPSFFAALQESNNFNKSLNAEKVIDFCRFDETLTYDAVHYTNLGNDLIFAEIEKYL